MKLLMPIDDNKSLINKKQITAVYNKLIKSIIYKNSFKQILNFNNINESKAKTNSKTKTTPKPKLQDLNENKALQNKIKNVKVITRNDLLFEEKNQFNKSHSYNGTNKPHNSKRLKKRHTSPMIMINSVDNEIKEFIPEDYQIKNELVILDNVFTENGALLSIPIHKTITNNSDYSDYKSALEL